MCTLLRRAAVRAKSFAPPSHARAHLADITRSMDGRKNGGPSGGPGQRHRSRSRGRQGLDKSVSASSSSTTASGGAGSTSSSSWNNDYRRRSQSQRTDWNNGGRESSGNRNGGEGPGETGSSSSFSAKNTTKNSPYWGGGGNQNWSSWNNDWYGNNRWSSWNSNSSWRSWQNGGSSGHRRNNYYNQGYGGGGAGNSSFWFGNNSGGGGSWNNYGSSGGGGSWITDWLPYSKYGKPVGGFFLPLKTPCDPKFDSAIGEKDRFYLKDFLQVQRNAGREVSLIINLAFTGKFYTWDAAQYAELGFGEVEQKHIPVEGRKVPALSLVNRVLYEIHDALKKHPDKYVAIHCTHGVNRTAFFVMAYLLRFGIFKDIESARAHFEEQRGEKMKRDYLSEGLQEMLPKIVVSEKHFVDKVDPRPPGEDIPIPRPESKEDIERREEHNAKAVADIIDDIPENVPEGDDKKDHQNSATASSRKRHRESDGEEQEENHGNNNEEEHDEEPQGYISDDVDVTDKTNDQSGTADVKPTPTNGDNPFTCDGTKKRKIE
ncbi:unnamed protein product [Amoebophrya sp. A25]|nr:unnamed protein product [Amoebophrya sp. A25]|eukprot:GSA25T00014260001.1